ncbi:hypothetical protein BaRGS_00040087 [Batillaria attramentaria]|uniref:Uncharacterized protein n=1 Tax=Batillaria attramentaria TaxID=370345 RepID=A0ABD0J1A7_9CAEN
MYGYGINDYKVQVNNRVKVYHANLLKKYVEREHRDKPQTASVACLSTEEELDDVKLFDLNEVRRKESIADVKLGPKLSQAQQDELKALTEEYEHPFTPDPGTTDTIQHEVNLTSDKPIRCKPYPLPRTGRTEERHPRRAGVESHEGFRITVRITSGCEESKWI